MDELEFTIELVKVLDKHILEKTLKRAGTRGFTVQGFNKNVWLAPAAIVIASLEREKWGGKKNKCMVFLEALIGLDEDNEGIYLARKWLKEDEDRVEAERELFELKAYKQAQRDMKEDERKAGIFKENAQEERNEKNTVELMQKQQERIRKLQNDKQEFRISKDNYKKEIEHLKKENRKLEKQCEEEHKKVEGLEEQIRRYIQQLAQKEEEINYYKKVFEKLPLILCFSKRKIEKGMFPLQKIEQISVWRNELVDEIEWKKFKEVWIIESDFSFPEVMEIRKMANGNVTCVRNMKSLIEKVGGIK